MSPSVERLRLVDLKELCLFFNYFCSRAFILVVATETADSIMFYSSGLQSQGQLVPGDWIYIYVQEVYIDLVLQCFVDTSSSPINVFRKSCYVIWH